MSLAFGDTRMDDKRLLVVDILTLFAPFSHTYIQSTGNMEIVLEFLIKSLICRLIVVCRSLYHLHKIYSKCMPLCYQKAC